MGFVNTEHLALSSEGDQTAALGCELKGRRRCGALTPLLHRMFGMSGASLWRRSCVSVLKQTCYERSELICGLKLNPLKDSRGFFFFFRKIK